MKREKFVIKEYKHWKLILPQNQGYLGRIRIWALRENALDFFDMNKEEVEELFLIGKQIRDVLRDLFKPDLFNYASAGNADSHLHIHVIPRYKEQREFLGEKFVDENWGKNHAPYNRTRKFSDEFYKKVRDLIREKLD